MGAEPVCAASMQPRPAHDIASLDGLRAVAIGIVILSHTRSFLPPWIAKSGLFRYVVGGGLHGCPDIFVLSGYLITTLLLREYERTGTVSLRRFYARRSLRIFPPFYAYLRSARHPLDRRHTFGTLAYLSCGRDVYRYDSPHPQGWQLLHTWSLSIEEQFYFLWPSSWSEPTGNARACTWHCALVRSPSFASLLLFALAHPAEQSA